MQIKIKDYASKLLFEDRCFARFPDHKLVQKMNELNGKTIPVDLSRLYAKEYVIDGGLKLPEKLIETVIDDIRPEYKTCGDCGRAVKKDLKKCPDCSGNEFLDIFTMEECL